MPDDDTARRRLLLTTALVGALLPKDVPEGHMVRAWLDLAVHAFVDPEAAVAEVKAEARVKPTGKIYRQDYVLFLRTTADKIAFLRKYFNPVRAAQALDAPILGLES